MTDETASDDIIRIDEIGARLQAYRIGHGLSPEEMAKALGISRAALYRAEKGEILKIELLVSITKVLGVSIQSLLGVDIEYIDTAGAFFERMRQLEESSEQIIGFFGSISYLLTSEVYDEMLQEVFFDTIPMAPETDDAIRRLIETLKARKKNYRLRRPLLVSLIASSDLERFLLHGLIGRQDLPEETRRRRRIMACREVRHISGLFRKQPIGVQLGILPQTVPSTSFQIFRQAEHAVLAISPFRLGEQPNIRVGVGLITTSQDGVRLHEDISRQMWEQALKATEAADFIDSLVEKYGVDDDEQA
ncbi:helix-turn-helix domain-containing protein [Ensifer sp. ENS11]|uniref:helix-turn-helix domain-containing protein n=1 Tax=Ensifer sp. ENS11 TaxID=2769291 RepID=UPI00177C2303|nr:helix-turn-helix domain-containing protein [Ensifer sp. ENS11]MBD9490508.1 helix-turn-helix domain-containing protein [Ensifer sp. ENS11]MDP9633044.1 transcriptional regulator with XRE-family HTH domain [Ensifer adhaerens]